MIRTATADDAEQLSLLNAEFNGEGETTVEHIRDCLANNHQEVVVVDDEEGRLMGFVCVQLKKSYAVLIHIPTIRHFDQAWISDIKQILY